MKFKTKAREIGIQGRWKNMKFVGHFRNRCNLCKHSIQLGKSDRKKLLKHRKIRRKGQKNIRKSRKVHEIHENIVKCGKMYKIGEMQEPPQTKKCIEAQEL